MGCDICMFVEVKGRSKDEWMDVLSRLESCAATPIGIRPLVEVIGGYAAEDEWLICSRVDFRGWCVDGKTKAEWDAITAATAAQPDHCPVWILRDYELFGALAGVRGAVEPISRPRGLPVDMSRGLRFLHDHKLVQWDYWHTYLSLDELDPETNPAYWNATHEASGVVKRGVKRGRNVTRWEYVFPEYIDRFDFLVWIRQCRKYYVRHGLEHGRMRFVFGFYNWRD